ARHVGLPGQNHQISHRPELVREDLRGADGASDDGQLMVALLLRQFDAPLDIADSLQILVDLAAIRSADLQAQPLDVRVDGIKDTAVFPSEGQTRLRIGARFAKKALEDGAWAVLHRKR